MVVRCYQVKVQNKVNGCPFEESQKFPGQDGFTKNAEMRNVQMKQQEKDNDKHKNT